MTKKQALELVRAYRNNSKGAPGYDEARDVFYGRGVPLNGDMFNGNCCVENMFDILESLAYSYNGDIA